MASPPRSWIASTPPQHQQIPQNLTQGATCQPLKDAIPQYYQHHQQPHYSTRAFVAPSPTMQSIQSTPALTFGLSPDQSYSADMDSFELDHDILNNLDYLEDFNFVNYLEDVPCTSYNDFTLFPTDESFIESPFTDGSLFPDLAGINTPGPAPANLVPTFICQYGNCRVSFQRQCELTRHEYKHTRPFICPQCGRDFPEKRRCVQHVQSVHGLATDKDKTQCHLCKYSHVRPDAVKRHQRLKHGVGLKSWSSPSTNSEKAVGAKKSKRHGR